MNPRLMLCLLTMAPAILRAAPPVRLAPDAQATEVAKTLAERLPAAHLSHRELDDGLSEKAFTLFLDSLDFDRSFFTAEDEAAFRKRAKDLDDMLLEGDVTWAYEVFETYRERVRNRVAYVDQLLTKGFDTAVDETYDWKRDKAPRMPAADWDDLWRRKTKHQYVGRLVADEREKVKAAEEADATNATEKVSVTNATDKAAATTNATEKASAEAAREGEKKPPLTPEEHIRKQYKQLLSSIEAHDTDFVLTMFLNAVTRSYDTHTNYMSPREEEDFDINMRLSLQGIGALLEVEDGAPSIKELTAGGPAERDGRLKPGDRIVAVQQGKEGEVVDILYWPLYKSVRVIRGAKGSTVVLHVQPASDRTGGRIVKIDLVREEIKLEDREASREVREVNATGGGNLKIGVITLPEFYADLRGRHNARDAVKSCAADVKKLLVALNEDGVDGLVLDLRDNGGGSLPDCVEMTGYFIDRGPVVQVKMVGQPPVPYRDPYPGALFKKPVVILVNRRSASASEILAAALQDYGRAIIVGDQKTHGKGSVQTLIPLDSSEPKLGSLKITTAEFFRIDGRSTQLKGVSPDIHISSPFDALQIGEEFLPNVLPWSLTTPSRYQRVGQMNEILPKLGELSLARRQANPKFKELDDLTARIKQRTDETEVSLQLAKRMKLAQEEEELEKYQDELLEASSRLGTKKDDDKKKKAPDIIMDEGVMILRDLIEAQAL